MYDKAVAVKTLVVDVRADGIRVKAVAVGSSDRQHDGNAIHFALLLPTDEGGGHEANKAP